MNNRLLLPQNIERHLKLWIYLLPIVGVIPAVWTLYLSPKSDRVKLDKHRAQNRVSRLSLKLVLIWLISYSTLSFGAASASEIISFRLLYANAIVTTAYFVACTFMMIRLGKKSKN